MLSALIILLIIIEVICSILLTIAILLQRSKGQGLGMALGAEMGESLFGARASDVLLKTTVWLTTIFLCVTLALTWLYSRQARSAGMPSPLSAPARSGSMPQSAPAQAPLAPLPAHETPAAIPMTMDLPDQADAPAE